MDVQLKALAARRRREILELVRDRELAAGQIATHFEITRPAVSQHLTLLKEAGLLVERRDGVRRLYRADTAGLVELKRYIDGFWAVGLDRLKSAAEAEHQRDTASGTDGRHR
jgi:DNA-binding transcriptional ArsR family regulator